MKNIYIFCDGGLGNRLGVLIGGLLTSDYINRSPIICWPKNNWCGCSFDDIFETDFTIQEKNINELFNERKDDLFLIHENQTNFIPPKIFSHTIDSLNTIKKNDDDVVYYHNIIPEYFSEKNIIEKINSLQIKKNLSDILNKFILENKINNDVIGIHFRKTDFGNFIDENKILEDIQKNQNINYFICSDDKDTENKFVNLPNVKIFEKTDYVEKLVGGDWNEWITDREGRKFRFNVNRNRESVIQAFIDLLILSRTKMMGNEQSTFFKFAKFYSKIKI